MAAATRLQAEDYLWPLTTLRDTLLNPGATLPSPKLRLIFTHHIDRLRTPWRRAKSGSKDGPNVFSQPTVSPAPGVQVDIDEPSRALASKLAECTGIAGAEACLLVKSYTTYVQDGSATELDALLVWYSEECLALAQIALEILHLAAQAGDSEWVKLAQDIREEMMPDAAEYMEGLFKGWAGLAQQGLGEKQARHALFWSSHQLRLQSAVLEILFLVLYQTPERPILISEGLVRGFMASSFATEQANRDVWESDTECQRLSVRIRDLALLIVLDAIGIGGIVEPGENELVSALRNSKDAILSLHLFINDQTSGLSPGPASSEGGMAPVFPMTPLPAVSLAWAILLHSLPPDRMPPNTGYEGQAYQEMAARSLAESSGLFPWLGEILTGPLLSVSPLGASRDRNETSRRKVLKDLLIGLVSMMRLSNLPDRADLYNVWDMLFSTGSPSTSLALSADYWVADHPQPLRRALLDESRYPYDPALLPNILTSLSGITDENAAEAELFDVRPIQRVAEYFSNLEAVVIPTETGWYRFLNKDAEGRMLVEAARDLVLPGGKVVHAGSQGVVLEEKGARHLVTWQIPLPGWTIMIEVMRAASGLRDLNQRGAAVSDNCVCLSVADLGGKGGLLAGLRLLSCVLKPIGGIAARLLTLIPPTGGHAVYTILEIVFQTLQQIEADDYIAATLSLDILTSLLHFHPSLVSAAIRSTGFFGVPGRKRGLAYSLVHADSARGTHEITASLHCVVSAMVACSFQDQEDDASLRAAVHHTFADAWSMFAGWRYAEPTRKYVLASRLCELYETILSHPTEADGITLTAAAQATIEVFITSASTITYRPIVELLVQGPAVAQRMAANHQVGEAAAVTRAVEAAINLLSALLRVSIKSGVSAANLPFSLFSATSVVDGEKVSLVEAILHLAVSPSTSVRTPLLKLVRTFLNSTALDPRKPSLAGLLRNADTTCAQLSRLAAEDAAPEQRAALWDLLATIISTQPGCAPACIGLESALAAPLDLAVTQLSAPETFDDIPQVLSSALAFCHAALIFPSATSTIPTLRTNKPFWKAIYDIASTSVPTPPTFQLSIHTPDFAARITSYAYATQARANAAALLATELQLLGDDEEKSEALDLIMGTWRNGERLAEMVGKATHSSCEPELQAREGKRLEVAGIRVERSRSTRMLCERDYGIAFLYDGNPQARDPDHQPVVNLALDTLNLNWSMLEADIALTRAFRSLADNVASWAEGDPLAAKTALRAAAVVGEITADERRSGDAMRGVHFERLSILAVLLQIALAEDVQVDSAPLDTISAQVRTIIENPEFPPILSMRQPELPPIHRPTLDILQSLFARLAARPMTISIENTVEVGGSFILEAADLALDSVRRGTGAPSDLALTTTPLCEMIGLKTTVWLDKLASSNLIQRSLELVNRVRIQSGNVPAYLPSVLLLHLALANHPRAAEKLAVSGILPAYGDNAIATEAEYGRITPDVGEYSVHSAWCGMLLVVKTLLASLPDTASFVRSDVIPFVRLTTFQTIKSLSWDADSPLSLPAIQEMSSTIELFHAISTSIGANITLLSDFSSAALPLLVSIRFALNHPRLLSAQIAPSTEEEQAALHKELEHVEAQQEVVLVDFAKTPILGSRTADLVKAARTVLLTLVGFSGAWDVMTGQRDADEGLVIITEEEVNSASADPVGIINDFQSLANTLSDQISATTDEGTVLLRVCHQLAEAGSLLSASQILLRRAVLPERQDEDSIMRDDEKVGKGGRVSIGSGSERDRAEGLLRELEGDWRAISNGAGAVGDRALGRWLEEGLERAFEDVQE